MASVSDPMTLTCGLQLQNRFVKAAMAESIADKSNIPKSSIANIYKEWDKGNWGLILTGNVQVDPLYLGTAEDFSTDPTKFSNPAYIAGYRNWAQSSTTPLVVQINHPGRQSPMGSGSRGLFAKNVAPSAVPLNFGSGLLPRIISRFIFGVPRALSTKEVEGVIEQFVSAAKFMQDSGFAGVELHGAHGYLLSQFMGAQTNVRDDAFGGSAAKRVEVVVRIIEGIRKVTGKGFCVGIKLNSVDASKSGASVEEFLEQVGRIVEAGIDFLEISGGSYEDPKMAQHPESATETKKASTIKREAFFLEFASSIRERFPSVPLMVTGGFRSLFVMNDALSEGKCDLIGLGRPSALKADVPKDVLDKEGKPLYAPKRKSAAFFQWLGIGFVGSGAETLWYASRLRKLGA